MRTRLRTLPDRLEHPALIPLADAGRSNFEYTSGGVTRTGGGGGGSPADRPMPLAFMAGRIHRTNEVLVHLGDNWFVEQSAAEAIALADRRLAKLDELLADLRKERRKLEDWLASVQKIEQDQQEYVEIFEEYDEQKEREWREQHRQRVRQSRRLEAEQSRRLPGLCEEKGARKAVDAVEPELAGDEGEVEQEGPTGTAKDTAKLPNQFAQLATIAERAPIRVDSENSAATAEPTKPMSKFKAERLARAKK